MILFLKETINGIELKRGDQFTDGEGNIVEIITSFVHPSDYFDGTNNCKWLCYINWKFITEDLDTYRLGRVFYWKGNTEMLNSTNTFLPPSDIKYFKYPVPKLKEKIDLL